MITYRAAARYELLDDGGNGGRAGGSESPVLQASMQRVPAGHAEGDSGGSGRARSYTWTCRMTVPSGERP
jgi:hypothetical protein